jgi:hypothetical protein
MIYSSLNAEGYSANLNAEEYCASLNAGMQMSAA